MDMMRPSNDRAWALGKKTRAGFSVRRIVWGLLAAECEVRPGEQVRAARIAVERVYKKRRSVLPF